MKATRFGPLRLSSG